MNFKINRIRITEYFKKMAAIAPTIAHHPKWTGMFIEVFDTRIVLEAKSYFSNIKIEISDMLDVKINNTGKVLVKAKMVNEIVSKMKGEFIEFIMVENNLLIIKSEDSEYEINVLEVDDFAKTTFLTKKDIELIVKTRDFKDVINRIIFAADEKSPRRIFQGINLIFEKNELNAVATDNVRVAWSKISAKANENFNKTISLKSLKDIIRVLDDKGELKILFFDQKIVITIDEMVVDAALIDGIYPNLLNVFPKKTETSLCIKKEEIVPLIERTVLINTLKVVENIIIKLIVKREKLILESREMEIGYANVSTSKVIFQGEEPFQISFNPNYLLESIKNVKDTNIEIMFNGSDMPFMIKGKDETRFKCLIFPFKTS